MSLLRTLLSVLALLGLALGYGASQYAFFAGQAPAYAERIDQPFVKATALLLLSVSILMAFVPEKPEAQN